MMSQQQIYAMKVGIGEVMQDMHKAVILPTSEQRVQETMVGVAQVFKDTDLMGKPNEEAQPQKEPSKSISFKDLPKSGKVQLAAQAGMQLSPEEIEEQENVDKKSTMSSNNAKL